MIYFFSNRGNDFGIREFVEEYAPHLGSRIRFPSYEDLPGLTRAEPGTYILSALDQLTPTGLALVAELEARLRSGGERFRVLNSPRRTLQRFDLLDALHREGLNKHGAARVRAGDATLRFPVFLREEHQHNGPLSPLLHTPADVHRAIARARVQGYAPEDLLLVEYFDAADAAGLYRKFAAHIIGTRILPHFVDVSRHWELQHGAAAFTEEMFREDQAYVRLNPHEPELRRIFALAGVEFGRIDYTLKGGAIETWEINLNPTFARYPALPAELERIRSETTALFIRAFEAAILEIDLPSEGEGIPLGLSGGEGLVRSPFRPRRLARWLSRWKPVRRAAEIGVRLVARLLDRGRWRPAVGSE